MTRQIAIGTADAAPRGILETPSISVLVGDNLRRLRKRNGLSLERLARASGVSRAMLGQIEQGRSAPTINVLWKIAAALNVSVTAFTTTTAGAGRNDVTVLRAHRAKWLALRNGRFATRALNPAEGPRRIEFHEAKLAAHTVEAEDAFPPGTTKSLVLSHGGLDVEVGGTCYRLEIGDALHFVADQPHAYRNATGVEAIFFQVTIFTEPAF